MKIINDLDSITLKVDGELRNTYRYTSDTIHSKSDTILYCINHHITNNCDDRTNALGNSLYYNTRDIVDDNVYVPIKNY